jgi:hypothetical protein
LLHRFYALMGDSSFVRSITYGTNNVKEVRYRFDTMRRTLAEVFDA